MANFVLTPGQDIITGSTGNDIFFANSTSLNSGDQINGGAGFDIFDFSASSSGSFGGFQLNGIERFQVFIASGTTSTFNMSGSNNIDQLILRFTEGAAFFDNVDLQVNDLFAIDTVGTAVFDVDYNIAQTAGNDDTVKVFVDSAGLSELDISNANGGLAIENLIITAVDGSSVINNLDSQHVTLELLGAGDFAINQSLEDTIKMIDASGLGGDLTISTTGNDNVGTEDVTIIGSAGVNTIATGESDDTVTTFGGDDRITSQGGDDVVNAGDGRDKIIHQDGFSGGDVTFNGEGGKDVFDMNDDFDEDDTVDGGDGRDELRVDNTVSDSDFAGVTSVEIFTQTETASATLGTMAQAAGITQINFDRTGNENNTIDASGMTVDLKFAANYQSSLGGGGSDDLTGGSGNDLFNMAAGFGGEDQIVGGAGFDEIKVRGDTTVGSGDFSGIELITLGSSIGDKPGEDASNSYHFDLDDTNAPDNVGPGIEVLTIDGSELQLTATKNETLVVNDLGVNQVTTYSLDLTGGAADDLLWGGQKADVIRGGGGDDSIRTGDGQDTVYGGGGADDIRLVGSGADTVHYLSVSDSSPSAEGLDVIRDWDVDGNDSFDFTLLEEAAGLTAVSFLGNYLTVGDAQADTTAGSGFLQAAYVYDVAVSPHGVLYVDANDDGVLNGDDLQIVIRDTASLNNQDVGDGDLILATAAPAPEMIMEAISIPETSFPVDAMMALA